MKKTLVKINELVENGTINKYAIGGGMGQFYYIEPSITYDLDIVISFTFEKNKLTSLQPIYEWARKNNYELLEEHIIIEGIPVQFLPVYNDLVEEALEKSKEIKLYDVKTYILSAEYLMAILLQTGRAKDKERLIKFFEEAKFSKEIFNDIIKRFDLIKKYKEFKRRYYE
jgi:hypothetical protein